MAENREFVVQSVFRELSMQHERGLNTLKSMLDNMDTCTCDKGFYDKMSNTIGLIANLELKMSYMSKAFAKPEEEKAEDEKKE